MTAARDVVVVDLGLGNLRSVMRAFERVGAAPTLTRDPKTVRGAGRLVVPGQGGFRDCATVLSTELGESVREALARGTRYFGICLGMQALFESSEEAAGCAGLGWFKGAVVRFDATRVDAQTGERLKVPHIGWNEVRGARVHGWFYFVHSYHCVPADASIVAGVADYGAPFCAAIAKDNVFACQFHPEKSQGSGEALLRTFLEDRWS